MIKILLIVILFFLGCNNDDSVSSPPENDCGEINYYQYYLDQGIVIPQEYQFTASHLSLIDSYNEPYHLSRDSVLTSPYNLNNSYIFFEGTESQHFNSWYVMISAPHSQRMYRYTEENNNIHVTDKYTGAIAEFMHYQLGVPIICSKYKSDDPNYYDSIPSNTQTALFIENNNINEIIPFKQKLDDYITSDNVINIVIDLHGFDSNQHIDNTTNADDDTLDIIIGTIDGSSLQTNLGCFIPEIIEHIFAEHGISGTSINPEGFTAGINQTVTKYVVENISLNTDKNLDAIQMEVDGKYRFEIENDDEDQTENRVNFIKALAETIYVLNYLYDYMISGSN